MPCWVVPTIAAEIWGVSVEHVLQRLRAGELAQRVDEGFLFVDVEPPAPPTIEHPPTFTVLSAAEVEAFESIEHQPVVESSDDGIVQNVNDDENNEGHTSGDDEASVELGDWRAARRRVGRTRIPPALSVKQHAA